MSGFLEGRKACVKSAKRTGKETEQTEENIKWKIKRQVRAGER